MAPAQPVTESIILHVKEGVNLENAASGVDASGNPAAETFLQLTENIKAQQGFIYQYWVNGLQLFSTSELTHGGSSNRRSEDLFLVYRSANVPREVYRKGMKKV